MLARVRSNLSLADLVAALLPARDPAAALEQALAERFGFPHALLFPYARTALHALLVAGEWQGRRVLCPAYICAEVPHAVTASGNEVCFVDSADDHFLPGRAEWQNAAGPDAAMAIVTPLFGYPVDKSAEAALRSVAKDIFVLYDESQSYGVTDESGLQMRDADGALLSFGLGKMITALSGGLLLLRDTALYDAVRSHRDGHYSRPGTVQTLKLAAKGGAAWAAFREPAVSALDLVARRFHLLPAIAEDWIPVHAPRLPADGTIMPSPYQAKIGLRQLARLDRFLAARRGIGGRYEAGLSGAGLRTFTHGHEPLWPRYPWPVARRETVVAALRQEGIQVSTFLPYSCADLPVYRQQGPHCPNAARWGRSMINLPNWHGVSTDQAEHVLRALLRLKEREPGAMAWPTPTAAEPAPARQPSQP